MNISQKIREQGKEALKGNWTSALIALFILLSFILGVFVIVLLSSYICEIFNLSTNITSVINILTGVISAFFLSPIFNGYLKFHYVLSNNSYADVGLVFDFFKNGRYSRALLFNLNLIIRCYSFYYTVIISGITLLYSSLYSLSGFDSSLTSVLSVPILILQAFIIFSLILSDITNNYVTCFIFCDNPDMKINEYFNNALFRKYFYKDNFKLVNGYIPWILSCFFVLPVFYAVPYFTSGIATSAKWLIKLYKDGQTI